MTSKGAHDFSSGCETGRSWVNHSCQFNSPTIQPKTLGKPSCEDSFGNPCNASNGNKYQQENDYINPNTGLTFIRYYNNGSSDIDIGLGQGWTHQWAAKLEIGTEKVTVQQSDGRSEIFSKNGGIWQGDVDTHLLLTEDSTGYTLVTDQGVTEHYDLGGQLFSQIDLVGLQTTYSHYSNNLVDTITGPFGHTLSLTY